MTIHRLIALPLIVSLAMVTVYGQEPPPQKVEPTEEEPVPTKEDSIIRVVTELVELRVVVTDKKGQPITDLRREEFVLQEDGAPQEISFFSAVEIGTSDVSEGVDVVVPRRSGSLEEPRPMRRDPPERTVMLFVDTQHMSPSSLHRVKKSLHDFVDEQMTDQDLAAVVSTKRGLGVTGQFSRNRHVLGYAIDKLSPGQVPNQSYFTPYLAAQVERGDRQALQLGMQVLSIEEMMPGNGIVNTMSSFSGEAEEEDGALFGTDFLVAMTRSKAVQVLSESSHYRRTTLSTLKLAADRMADLPGQRLLVLYSDGFTLLARFGDVDASDLRTTVNRAVNSGVIIYSIDAKGLQPPPMFDASSRGQYGTAMFSFLTSSEKDMEDSLNALAKDTGGETFFNTNDLTGAMRQALDDNRYYYRLGYYPAEKNRENYGRFKVRVDGYPEYRIRTQRGYSPTEFRRAAGKEGERTPEEAFQEAVLAPLPVTNIGVTVRPQFLEAEVDDAQVSLHTHIEGDRLPLHDEGMGRKGRLLSLELLTYVIDKDGKSVDGKSQMLRMTLQPEAVEHFRREGIYLTRRLELKPGLYQIRVGVRDRETELTGTAASWIEVPKLPRKKLAMSSIILLDWKETRDALDETKVEGEWTSSELKEGFRFYRPGDAFSYFLVVYHGEKMDPDNDLLVKAEFRLKGEAVVSGSWQPLSARRLGEEEGGSVIGGQIELTQTRPGIYEFIVSVKKLKSKKTTQRTITFGISG